MDEPQRRTSMVTDNIIKALTLTKTPITKVLAIQIIDAGERVLEFVDGAAKVQLQVSPVGGVRR